MCKGNRMMNRISLSFLPTVFRHVQPPLFNQLSRVHVLWNRVDFVHQKIKAHFSQVSHITNEARPKDTTRGAPDFRVSIFNLEEIFGSFVFELLEQVIIATSVNTHEPAGSVLRVSQCHGQVDLHQAVRVGFIPGFFTLAWFTDPQVILVATPRLTSPHQFVKLRSTSEFCQILVHKAEVFVSFVAFEEIVVFKSFKPVIFI